MVFYIIRAKSKVNLLFYYTIKVGPSFTNQKWAFITKPGAIKALMAPQGSSVY